MPNDDKIRDILSPRNPTGKVSRPKPKKSGHPILFAGFAIFVIFGIAFGAKISDLRSKALSAGGAIYKNALAGASALEDFDTQKARGAFTFVNEKIAELKNELDKIGFSKILSFGEIFTPLAKEIPGAISDFTALSARVLSLTNNADKLANDAFSMAFNKQGAELLKLLRNLQADLKEIIALNMSLKNHAVALRLSLPENYSAMNVRLYRGEALLDSLLRLLETDKDLHIAVLFQNPSEIRPAGGFIGSYADIALVGGSITSIDVRDIYDPDGWIEEKITPPLPLQAITNVWEARDANWFFDFPTSAEKVLSMLNRSKIYSEKNIAFEAALAINVRLIEDLLEILGDIPLPEYNLTVTKTNFLEVVQKEVESGEDKAKGEPKKILKVMTPILLERLASASGGAKKRLVETFQNRIRTKDILAYTKDRVLEGYLQNEGIGGEIYLFENQTADDYLAIVHANIAGGKTDALIKETVLLESSLDPSGKIANKLTIEREHTGGDKKEWWYRSDNKDYFQILTPAGTRLLNISGHDKKSPAKPQKSSGHINDPDVSAIERSLEWLPEFKISRLHQFGKNTFANYLTIKAGEKKMLVLEYENSAGTPPSDGGNYRFVYERQSGVQPNLRYVIEAPSGYIWRESGQNKYSYETDNPEGRLILDLTLEKSR